MNTIVLNKKNIYKKKRNYFLTLSLKKYIIPIIFVSFTICLVLFSNSNLQATKNGLNLWFNNVVPSLLPFFIATELLSYTDISQRISKIFSKLMKPLFNVPGNGAYAFILGIISGYPIGARIVTSFRNNNLCTKNEGERMLAFTNNSGPLFIISTVGITLFKSTAIGILLLLTHILSSITVGILLGFHSRLTNKFEIKHNYNINYNQKEICTFNNLGEILGNSILNSIKTVTLIGGFVVLFSVIISILQTSKILNILSLIFIPIFKILNVDISFIKPTLIGFIELTNGVSLVSSIPCKFISINIIICAFLVGFGGLSILLQVLSITSKSDLSIKTYIYGKLLQGIIAAFYTYICISNFNVFKFNL